MTEVYTNFKPLEDGFLLTEHTMRPAFAASAMNGTDSESALHRLISHQHRMPHKHVVITFGPAPEVKK
jgi:hypothetical protein